MSKENTTNAPYTTHFEKIADMEAWVGKEIGLTDWMTIDQNRINQFAEATDDEQWIHTDPERCAKESPFKTPIAHGFLVLSLASAMCYKAFSFGHISMGINYGLDKVRFMNATPVNAQLRGRVSLLTYDAIKGGAKYKVNIVFELEGAEKPACIAEFVAIAYGA